MAVAKDLFGPNKQKVREMDTRLIDRYLGDRTVELRYLGLPASTLTDIALWMDRFSHFTAVERGRDPYPFLYQHDLVLTAFRLGIASKITLLRGDMDDILIKGHDDFGSLVLYPYDVVSLDYSGGLIYKNNAGSAKRTDSMQALFSAQAGFNKDFLLLLSFNMDNEDRGEVISAVEDIGRYLGKHGLNVAIPIRCYLTHELDEARLKLYVPYLIIQQASQWYQCEHFKPIFYKGNRGVRMMHFSVWLKRTTGLAAGRPSRQTLLHILNLPAFQCVDGELTETNFGIEAVDIT